MTYQRLVYDHPMFRPTLESLLVHLVLMAALVAQFWFPASPRVTKTDFEVYTQPRADSSLTIQMPSQTKIDETQRAIFGSLRKALRDESSDVIPKTGNTLAKEADDLVLQDEDAESLPIPIDEYLVTSLPQLVKEVRVTYPPEAKARGVQGSVILAILIDDSGIVRKAEVVQGQGYGLDEAAVEAIKSFLFLPAKVGEKTVAVQLRYVYRFLLE